MWTLALPLFFLPGIKRPQLHSSQVWNETSARRTKINFPSYILYMIDSWQTQMANINVLKCSISLTIRQMQLETMLTMPHSSSSDGIQKPKGNRSQRGCGEESHWWDCRLVQPLESNSSSKVIDNTCSRNPTKSYNPSKMEQHMKRNHKNPSMLGYSPQPRNENTLCLS